MKALLFLLVIPLVGFSQLGEITEPYKEPRQYYKMPVFGNKYISSHDLDKSNGNVVFYVLKNESTITIGDGVKGEHYNIPFIVGADNLGEFKIKVSDKNKVYLSGLKYPIKNDIITANGLVIAYKEEKGSWYLSGNITID